MEFLTSSVVFLICLRSNILYTASAFQPFAIKAHYKAVYLRSQLDGISKTSLFAGDVDRKQRSSAARPRKKKNTSATSRSNNSILYSSVVSNNGRASAVAAASTVDQRSFDSTATFPSDTTIITTTDETEFGDLQRTILESSSDDATTTSPKDFFPVLTTALLVTGNTVGAGALVLPELAAKPGFAISTTLFVGAYLVNLLSGLLLAEVAILQHEQGGLEAPSSFREFATSSLEKPALANAVWAVSLFVNTCALTFSLGKAGVMLSDIISGLELSGVIADLDHVVWSVAFSALLAVMATTQSRVRMSKISSVFVSILFAAVAALILPGLGNVADPLGTFLAPGVSNSDTWASVADVAPIMLTTLIFQNIVPPVTKILDYDRAKCVSALTLGSVLPLILYLTWSFVVLGGGVHVGEGLDNPLVTAFSVAAVTGSSIGCTMAVSEELQAFLSGNDDEAEESDKSSNTSRGTASTSTEVESSSGYSFLAVLMAISVPLVCSTLCNEYSDALKLSGGFGIPILYGTIPVAMAWKQRSKLGELRRDLIPGKNLSLGIVGVAFGAFMLQSLAPTVLSAGELIHLV